jgi:hypothetical protein
VDHLGVGRRLFPESDSDAAAARCHRESNESKRNFECPKHNVEQPYCASTNTVSYDIVSYGTISHGTVSYDIVSYGTVSHNTISHDTISYNTISYDTVPYYPGAYSCD